MSLGIWGMGLGDWALGGLGIGIWGLGILLLWVQGSEVGG